MPSLLTRSLPSPHLPPCHRGGGWATAQGLLGAAAVATNSTHPNLQLTLPPCSCASLAFPSHILHRGGGWASAQGLFGAAAAAQTIDILAALILTLPSLIAYLSPWPHVPLCHRGGGWASAQGLFGAAAAVASGGAARASLNTSALAAGAAASGLLPASFQFKEMGLLAWLGVDLAINVAGWAVATLLKVRG